MNPQHIVILGGTGFVGRRLIARLAADGHALVVLTRHRERHRHLAVTPRTSLRRADVHDLAELRRHLQGADAVINLIGILNPDRQHSFRRVHVELVRSLIAACHEVGVTRLHQMSSLKAGQGLSDYLKSRGEAEVLIRQSGLNWTIYQSSVIFGEGDGLVSRFDKLLRRTPAMPLARANAKMAPTWVGDVVEAIARVVSNDRLGARRSFELYGPQVLTLEQIVRAVDEAAGRRTPIFALPDSLGRLQAQIAEMLPGKPFSLDNFHSLRTDSVGKVDGYAALGITPQPFTPALARLLGGPQRQRTLDLARTLRR